MQLRCTYCQTMFAVSRDEMLAALEHMDENKLTYYDAHCPKCRRANRIERARMERFFPDWKKALRTMAKESAEGEAEAAKTAASSKPAKVAPAKPAAVAASPKKKPAGASSSKDEKPIGGKTPVKKTGASAGKKK